MVSRNTDWYDRGIVVVITVLAVLLLAGGAGTVPVENSR